MVKYQMKKVVYYNIKQYELINETSIKAGINEWLYILQKK